ncbi:MAG: TIGR04255 family protein [Anaerolineales bacterium]|nr:TIGR04255 family protein [Anaerolineales bacterium]
MPTQKLSLAPLIETILEVRWQLVEQSPGLSIDPRYKILVGRLYDRLASEYPFHEPLPTASMPDEMLGYIVQHRFRVGQDQWPLVQVGPGLVTLNETKNYTWEEFEPRCQRLVDTLFETYPSEGQSLSIVNLQLRYIDAIPFDFSRNDILAFITENLKINLSFPASFFENTPIQTTPEALNALFVFPVTEPKGSIRLRFGRGKREQDDALIWETVVQSDTPDIPEMPSQFKDWLSAAHTLTHNMFFKLIKGSLEEQFK